MNDRVDIEANLKAAGYKNPTPQQPLTFPKLMDKFIFIGNTAFNGKINDNVLNIFDVLGTEEQKNILRGTVNLYYMQSSPDIFMLEVNDPEAIKKQRLLIDRAAMSYTEVITEKEAKPEPVDDKTVTQTKARRSADDVTPGFTIAMITAMVMFAFWVLVMTLSDDPDSLLALEKLVTFGNVFFKALK